MCKAYEIDMAAIQAEVDEIVKACKGYLTRKDAAERIVRCKIEQAESELRRLYMILADVKLKGI